MLGRNTERTFVITLKDVKRYPPGYVALAWATDFVVFGISVQQLYNPADGSMGVLMKKGKDRRAVIFGGNVKAKDVYKAMRKMEEHFGIPLSESPYKDLI